ncbi:glycosyltransferase [Paenibacillus sp. 5J-6]|uniref:Glucosyl-3-phosphoglycerate synthase n=1 Tax=Paenibacillus silvestris TaxID=2606219 RepID=A0A6L8V6W2_9BACL|nr:glycosyltransferase [Paenibacillus silvestris]
MNKLVKKRVKQRPKVRTVIGVRRMRRSIRPTRTMAMSLLALRRRVHAIGTRYATDHPLIEGMDPRAYISSLWYCFYTSREIGTISTGQYLPVSRAFLEGYSTKMGIPVPNLVLVPTRQSIGAVITVSNEEKTIARVLNALERLPIKEIIVVINGSTDNSVHIAKQCPHATIVHYPNLVGHDVGRSIGAKLTSADMVLFLDGDIPVQTEELLPFIRAIDQGWDIGLNNISPYLGHFTHRDGVSMVKQFVNRVQGRPELNANSMTAIPHMLSRKALEIIGSAALMVPPKAQAKAIRYGLRICAPASIDVVTANKPTRLNTGTTNPVSNLIVGDHLEALHMLLHEHGRRLEFRDVLRTRTALAGGSI